MAQPLRRRDRRPRLEDDYYGPPDPYNPYDERAAPPYVSQDSPPPRRHKSERRRRPSPGPGGDAPPEPRRRRHRSNDAPSSRSIDPALAAAGPRRSRAASPPPFAPEPPRYEKRSSRNDRDPYARERMPSRGYPPEPDPRARGGRPRRASTLPAPDPRWDDSHDRRSRPRGRDYPPPAYYDDEPRRRPQSRGGPRGYGGAYARGRSPSYSPSPPRRRSRPPPTKNGRPRRGNSVPADSGGGDGAAAGAAAAGGAAGGAAAARRASWWKHPLVQAGGRAAFTAGAQAAMRERKERGEWMGSKGAKVATAALGAALVDGFIGSNNHPNTHPIASEGVGMATDGLSKSIFDRVGR